MIRFQQKEFWGAALGIGSTVLGLGGTMAQTAEQERMAEETQGKIERQNELIKAQNRKLDQLTKAGGKTFSGSILSQRQYTGALGNIAKNFKTLEPVQKLIANVNKTKVGNAALTVGKAANDAFGKEVGNNILMGGATAGAVYAGGKVIQNNMKKNNLEMGENGLQTRSYAAAPTAVGSVLGTFKDLGKGVWKHKNTVGMGVGMSGIPLVTDYMKDKKALNDQVNATTSPIPEQQKQFAFNLNFIKGGIKGGIGDLKKNWNTFKSHKMQTITGFGSNMASFGIGGTKNIQKFGQNLEKMGAEGSAVSNAGKWIQNHKTAANAISIIPGAGAAALTWDGTQSAVNSLGHKMDSGAYEYKDAKDKLIKQQQQ